MSNLSKERLLCLEVIKDALAGRKLDRVFGEAVSGLRKDPNFRVNQAYKLTYGLARLFNRLWTYTGLKLRKAPPDTLRIILMLGIYELAYNDSSKPYASVDQALKLCERLNLTKYKGLVNAILQGFLRNISKEKTLLNEISFLPDELVLELKKAFPEIEEAKKKDSLLKYFLDPAPIFLRINSSMTSRDGLFEKLLLSGVELEKFDFSFKGFNIEGLRTFDPTVFTTKEFKDGLFFIQDLSSQLAVYLLDPKDGMEILDLCSAPGGKSLSISLLCSGQSRVLSVDSSASRLMRLHENIKRLKIPSIEVINRDIVEEGLPEGMSFDRVFLDPPCTALGVLRRNPDVAWRDRMKLAKQLSSIQLKMLLSAMDSLKRGGRIVYSVCTFTSLETTDVINKALEINRDFKLSTEPFNTLINEEGMDGLFIAVMEKL